MGSEGQSEEGGNGGEKNILDRGSLAHSRNRKKIQEARAGYLTAREQWAGGKTGYLTARELVGWGKVTLSSLEQWAGPDGFQAEERRMTWAEGCAGRIEAGGQ